MEWKKKYDQSVIYELISIQCPKCGSKHILRNGRYTKSSYTHYFKCKSCGYHFIGKLLIKAVASSIIKNWEESTITMRKIFYEIYNYYSMILRDLMEKANMAYERDERVNLVFLIEKNRTIIYLETLDESGVNAFSTTFLDKNYLLKFKSIQDLYKFYNEIQIETKCTSDIYAFNFFNTNIQFIFRAKQNKAYSFVRKLYEDIESNKATEQYELQPLSDDNVTVFCKKEKSDEIKLENINIDFVDKTILIDINVNGGCEIMTFDIDIANEILNVNKLKKYIRYKLNKRKLDDNLTTVLLKHKDLDIKNKIIEDILEKLNQYTKLIEIENDHY